MIRARITGHGRKSFASGSQNGRNQGIVEEGGAVVGSLFGDFQATSEWTEPMAKTILIVEDNELNMKLFHDLLEAHNYDTLQTRDGNEALELAREHRPDLILMDIQLPGVSGLEVTRQIKADDELKSIPIIAVTAFAMKGDEDRIREGGCEAYIAKPIRIDELVATVQKFINDD